LSIHTTLAVNPHNFLVFFEASKLLKMTTFLLSFTLFRDKKVVILLTITARGKNMTNEEEFLSTADQIAQTEKPKAKVHNEFVMTFIENFERLIPVLTKTEMRVMLCILKFLNYQNVYNLTQKAISRDTGITTAGVSKAMKVLRERKILAETEDGVGYINPYIFSKGHIMEVKKNIQQISFVFDGDSLETEEIKKPF